MLFSMMLFTLCVAPFTLFLFTYWRKQDKQWESWTFLFGMVIAWGVGLLFMSGLQLPTPTNLIFPTWQ